jgi:ketosteroid isomerase-like protein
MSQENVERLRAALEALRDDTSEHEWEGTLTGRLVELWDPKIEWDTSTHPLPDLAGVYRGREPVLRWWREWLGAWKAVHVEYELIEAGDRVVGLFNQRMRGRFTGIEVASGKYAMVFTFRDGRIVHAKFYPRRSEALEAVGLREPAMPRVRQ